MSLSAPHFTLDDVRYADDRAMFERAWKLFQDDRVGEVSDIGSGQGYRTAVWGSKPYSVSLSARSVDQGDCDCYMGRNDMLCKHILALALKVLEQTGGLVEEEPPQTLPEAKLMVNAGMKKIRAYTGPSRIWFSYQRKLSVGAGVIARAVSNLPASRENADYIWKVVLRLSKKLATGGVDDSDGVVGGCVDSLVDQLGRYAKDRPELKPRILTYCRDDTGFGFEDELRSKLE